MLVILFSKLNIFSKKRINKGSIVNEQINEMIKVDRLLTSFHNDKDGVRVVVDEFGGFVGVIGAEAVLAVLAGWWGKSKS